MKKVVVELTEEQIENLRQDSLTLSLEVKFVNVHRIREK